MTKERWRKAIWTQMDRSQIAVFPGARSRIPNFVDADLAAGRLAESDAWRAAFVLFVNAAASQRPVRYRALRDGKLLFVPIPRLDQRRCFLRLDPEQIPSHAHEEASSLRGTHKFGVPVEPKKVPLLDLMVVGSVAVNAMGQRVGRGGGMTDLAYGLGREHGFLLEETLVATTVHGLQLVEHPLPFEDHDFDLDIIATPMELVRTIRSRRRPAGILWELLSPRQLTEIPALGRLRRGRGALR